MEKNMKNMIYVLVITLLSFTIYSCAKKSDSTIGLDWRSDSFIYGCTSIDNITFSAHGSYSSSNTRLTWWDGSYDTVTSSGSNILLTSTTYSPAVLYATCNPFWT